MDNNINMIRLEKLKNATIMNYYTDINPDYDMDLYDKMFEHLIKGDFDDEVLAPCLEGVDYQERKNIFRLAKRYHGLCFFEGVYHYWTDSIEGIGVLDLDYLSQRILSNYDFLIRIAKDGGESTLKFISAFKQTKMSTKSAVVDYLRNSFKDDLALEKVLLSFPYDQQYSRLDNDSRDALFTYPLGTIYRYIGEDNDIRLLSGEELFDILVKNNDYISDLNVNSLEELIELIGYDKFRNLIREVYYNCEDKVKSNTLSRYTK